MLVERLFNSSLVVTVSQSNARKIRVYHFRKVICLIKFKKLSNSKGINDFTTYISLGSSLGQNESTEVGRMSWGVTLHSQYSRHVNFTHNTWYTAKPKRRMCISLGDRYFAMFSFYFMFRTIFREKKNIKNLSLIIAATDADDSCGYLAYPGSPIAGELNIFDTVNLRAVTQLNAHDNPIGQF